MKFSKFRIKNYKGISDEIEIDLSKKSLIPIIGVNECGKTTILNAICAFDFYNDSLNNKIKHLNDVKNLFQINTKSAELTSEMYIEYSDLKDIISDYFEKLSEEDRIKRRKTIQIDQKKYDSKVIITRFINDENDNYYKLIEPKFNLNDDEHNDLCEEILINLPFILYFDDFRDSFPEEIEIPESSDVKFKNEWIDHIEELFQKANSDYSVYKLKDYGDRQLKSILSDVSRYLNRRLTEEWSNFQLDQKDSLSISISLRPVFEKPFVSNGSDLPSVSNNIKYFLKFEISEKDKEGNERFFYIRDRSKGFYWFFNFVIKLEFNPKRNGSEDNAIYLLDEPGSYLHPGAQNKLCKKLQELSNENKVLYCTHSHYLLDPETIPLTHLQIANKNQNGSISITPFHSYKNENRGLESSFQTIYDALQVKPFMLDVNNSKVIIVEGIYDYYSINLFNTDDNLIILPGKSADSLLNLISIVIGFKLDYRVVWDGDKEGNENYEKAIRYFGEIESQLKFTTYSKCVAAKVRILQDLFKGSDLVMIREKLELDSKSSFEKTIASLYFHKKRNHSVHFS